MEALETRPEITDKDRAAIDLMLKSFDSARTAAEEQMAPFLRIVDIVIDGREALLDHYGVQPAGRCLRCHKLLFIGESGRRVRRRSETDLIYCSDHASKDEDLEVLA